MNAIKESLEANMAEILENLPPELHDDAKKEVAAAADAAPPSAEEELAAIKAEMTANPDIDEATLMAEVEKNPSAHRAEPPPSAEEQEAAKKEALGKVAELTAPDDAG